MQLTNFVLNCGDEDASWDRDHFDSFVRKVMFHSLALDQGVFQIVYNKAGQPAEFFAMDGKTIRRATSWDTTLTSSGEDLPRFVQLYQEEFALLQEKRELYFLFELGLNFLEEFLLYV